MAAPTYTFDGIVLKKTKLKESDLIVTLLAEDGSQKRVVAKGARKPKNSFSARLELFSECRLLCARGKSLDIVSEVRLTDPHERLRGSIELSTAAMPPLELLCRITQPELPYANLHAATSAGLSAFEKVAPGRAPVLTAAMLVKTLGIAGFRPSLQRCLFCGAAPDRAEAFVDFSPLEGGFVCPDCRSACETIRVEGSALAWLSHLMGSTYSGILEEMPDVSTAFSMLRIDEALIRSHIGAGLKSLGFMFACGLFE